MGGDDFFNEVKKTFQHLERFQNSRTMEKDRNDMENIKYQGEDVLTTIKNNLMNKKNGKKDQEDFDTSF
jgi:5'-3' exonuclease